MRSFIARLGAWCVERPAPVIALVVLLAIVGVIGAASLESNGEADTLVDKGSDTFAATEEFKDEFGDDPVVVLVRGESRAAHARPRPEAATDARGVPGRERARRYLDENQTIPTPAACNDLAEAKPARVVYGPATFLNTFATQANALLQSRRRPPWASRTPPRSARTSRR